MREEDFSVPAVAAPIASKDQLLLQLAERCEREAPSRELDADIFETVGGDAWERAYRRAQEPCGCPHDTAVKDARWRSPRYTTGLEAAVTLVPEDWTWSAGVAAGVPTRHQPWAEMYRGLYAAQRSSAATTALALSAAALRARAADVVAKATLPVR